MITEVDVLSFAAAHSDGAYVVDVREPQEYVAGHVPGARLVPLATFADTTHELPTNRPIYVICQSGSRSMVAAQHLDRSGRDARTVVGGVNGWIGAGRPIIRSSRQNLA